MKSIRLNSEDYKSLRNLMHEIFTLSHSISPSKVNLVEAFKFKTNYFLIMELMEGGSIDTLIE